VTLDRKRVIIVKIAHLKRRESEKKNKKRHSGLEDVQQILNACLRTNKMKRGESTVM